MESYHDDYRTDRPLNADTEEELGNLVNRPIPNGAKFVPPFSGDCGEKWVVWFARFEAVADAQRWTTSQRLSVLLPSLRNQAADYVFECLSHKVRCDYSALVRELSE